MYPSAAPGVDSFASAMAAAGLVGIGTALIISAIAGLISYAIIKAAVRDGVVQAIKKTGLGERLGGATYVQGYPPPQDLGAPLPPSHGGSGSL